MRSVADRLRHALSFELIGLLLVVTVGHWWFNLPLHDIGAVALVSSIIATAWVYCYNYLFDLALLRKRGTSSKTLPLRLAHSLLFEIGLLLVLLPFIAWYLHISLVDALIMDLSLAAFYLVYSSAYNWAYDLLFPVEADSATR